VGPDRCEAALSGAVSYDRPDDDGHLTLTVRHLDEIHAWLLERLD
jgi:hypothetical protein